MMIIIINYDHYDHHSAGKRVQSSEYDLWLWEEYMCAVITMLRGSISMISDDRTFILSMMVVTQQRWPSGKLHPKLSIKYKIEKLWIKYQIEYFVFTLPFITVTMLQRYRKQSVSSLGPCCLLTMFLKSLCILHILDLIFSIKVISCKN